MNDEVLKHTTALVSTYITHNEIDIGGIPDLIRTIYSTMSTLDTPAPAPQQELTPAVPIKKSVFPDRIICLDDGREFRSLKRHLAHLGMTPDEYRAKWGLPANYPMMCPEAAKVRSTLAKENGLGRKAA
jgi:predicted transcriptional regulator